MKQVRLTALFMILFNVGFTQTLVLQEDFPGITWPFLLDLEKDANDNLYVCSELGALYVKSDDIWTKFDIDSENDDRINGIAIDDNDVAWLTSSQGLYRFENDQVTDHYTSENSQLPAGTLRKIRFYDGSFWITLQGNGLVLKEGDNYTYYTSENSSLPDNTISDIEVMLDGTIIVSNYEIVNFIQGGQWTTYDFEDLFGWNTRVSDIYIDHNQDVWFGTRQGVIKYNSSTSEFEDLRGQYGVHNYSKLIYTPNDELWLCEVFEGLHYYDGTNNYFFEGNLQGQPSQVFDFLYYNDTLRVVGNIGATVTGLTIDNSVATYEIVDNSFSIYPNPVNEVLNIDVQNATDYSTKLFNSSGQIIFQDSNNPTIKISEMPKGIYWLEIIDLDSNQRIVEKIVVTK